MAKKKTIERLLKAGHIDFNEALELMEKEVVREFITLPQVQPCPTLPMPWYPVVPNQPWYTNPQITC